MANVSAYAFRENVISLGGDIAEMISFNRSIGQLYALLYFAAEPLSLEDIAAACKMSKGNASIQLRILEGWEAVQRSTKPGTRKDYYSANGDLRALALKRLQDGLGKRLNAVRVKFKNIKDDSPAGPHGADKDKHHQRARLDEVEVLLAEVERGFSLLPKFLQWNALVRGHNPWRRGT